MRGFKNREFYKIVLSLAFDNANIRKNYYIFVVWELIIHLLGLNKHYQTH